jgi:osmotically-inducible protein OsmY
MAEQHRRWYEAEFPQRGRGWSDRDDSRSRGDERGRFYETGADDSDRDRGWRDQGDRYARGDESSRGYERRPGGYQEGQYGQFGGSQYGGAASHGRGHFENDPGSRRSGTSGRGSDQRSGGGDWRTRAEWPNGPDDRDADEPFWGRSSRSSTFGGQGYGGPGYRQGYAGSSWGGTNAGTRSTSGRDWQREANRWFNGGGAGIREGYSGRGPKDYKRSDDRIREDVSDRLEQDAFVDASDITVEVRDGEVTLSGTVNTREQKRSAEDCIDTVSGVREVHNSLRVNRQDRSPAEMSTSMLGLGGQPPRDSTSESSSESAKRSSKSATGTGNT